jgi:hypothetical protein
VPIAACTKLYNLVIQMHFSFKYVIGFSIQVATPFLSNCRLREAKAERDCLSHSMCTLPLVTHSNNSMDRSLPNRQFENFEKCKNPEAKFCDMK